ncbi:hypothetical protein JB92DRAFT_384058 [Gautieria morchelliformis]|nr:hypothetical protein JB92DRAFT_384058 [Gautieria morchelliformis]
MNNNDHSRMPHHKVTIPPLLHSTGSAPSATVCHQTIPFYETYELGSYDVIDSVDLHGRKRFKCLYVGCNHDMFDQLQTARVHVALHCSHAALGEQRAITGNNETQQDNNVRHEIRRIQDPVLDLQYDCFLVPGQGSNQRQFKCGVDGCDHALFARRDKAREHVSAHHLKHYGYICTACDTGYMQQSQADRHAKIENGARFSCQYPQCPKMLTRQDGKAKHEKICKYRPTSVPNG